LKVCVLVELLTIPDPFEEEEVVDADRIGLRVGAAVNRTLPITTGVVVGHGRRAGC